MRRATAALTVALALLVAAPAEAATLTVVGSNSCYRAGDSVTLAGSGFTPGGQASITLDGQSLGVWPTDAAGNFSAPLNIGALKGVRLRTLVATDAANPANVAQAQFLGSALAVTVKPSTGAAGRRLRIKASGFTTGKRLYAHVVRGKFRSNVFIGKLKGPCRTATARRRVLSAALSAGVYTVQFDTKRRFSKKTKVWVKFQVTVTTTRG